VQITRRLAATDKVLAIAGPCLSGVAEVSFPVTNQMKIASVAVCSAKPGIAAKNRPWGFRNTTISTSMYGRGIALWAQKNNVKKAAIVYDSHDAFSKTDGTKVFPIMAKKAGVQIVNSVSFHTGDIDYSAQITKIKSMGVDGLLLAGLKEEAAHIARESRRQSLNLPIFGGADLSGPKFLELAGKQAVEGIYSVTALWVDSPDPRIQKFIEKFKPLYGTAPHFTAAQAYDTTYILKKIIEETGVTNTPGDLQKDRGRIRKGMEQLKNYSGLTGVTTMTKSGDVTKKILILVAKNGKFELVAGQ
jgi:branched-chain amino acid transport system substrate-binding protein